jgi:hypothetical protein
VKKCCYGDLNPGCWHERPASFDGEKQYYKKKCILSALSSHVSECHNFITINSSGDNDKFRRRHR